MLRRNVLNLIVVVLGSVLFGGGTYRTAEAVEASPHPFKAKQPDGTEITLRVRGTEYFNWEEDEQGFTVVRKGEAYFYALRGQDGQLSASALMVGKVKPADAGLIKGILPSPAAMQKTQQLILPRGPVEGAAPSGAGGPKLVSPTGNVKNVVILMRFSNHGGRTLPSQSDFTTIFNAVGGNPTLAPSGSVRDVYLENSYGALKLDSTVFAWVTLPKTEAHYADGNSGLTVRIRDAIRDALELADPLVNFSQFDQDSNGFVDAIAFVHSGYGAEWGGTDADGADFKDRIWSHRWTIPTWTSNEGVKVRDYHINPGLWSTSGTAPGRIGVICHETGHFFGLPDLYDTSGAGSGLGSWGMMANSWGFDGSQLYPPHFSAWSKIQLGWITPTVISSPGVYSAPQAEKPGAKIYKITSGYPSGEYLLIENRQPVGFDQKIPAGTAGKGGLAIWHIDEAKPANNDPGWPGQSGWPGNNKHYKVALLQADGNYNLEKGDNRGDAGDVYRGGFKDKIDSSTTPNTKGYQGGTVVDPGHQISEITETASTMRFRFGGEVVPTACCAVAASAQFPWSEAKKVSTNSNIAKATIKLDQEMEVHIQANTSAQTSTSGLQVRTGFYNQSATNTMWTDSLRRVNFSHPNRAVDFGSTFSIRLKPGTHTFYWKIWVGGGEVVFDSGCMTVEAFAIPGSGSSAATKNAAPAGDSEVDSIADSPGLTVSEDEQGNAVTQLIGDESVSTGDIAGSGGLGCCAKAASAQFPWSAGKKISTNSNIAEATITLDQEMEVHIEANTSAQTPKSGLMIRTGFYNQPSPGAMWTDSYRRVHFNHANSSVDFGSSFATRLKAGTHKIYWKIWVSGAEVTFDSGAMTIEAFAIPKSATASPATSLAPEVSEASTSDSGAPQRIVTSQDKEGNEITTFGAESLDRVRSR